MSESKMEDSVFRFSVAGIKNNWLDFSITTKTDNFGFLASSVQNDPISELLLVARDLKRGVAVNSRIRLWREPESHWLYFAQPSNPGEAHPDGADRVLFSVLDCNGSTLAAQWMRSKKIAYETQTEFNLIRDLIIPTEWKYGFPETLLPSRSIK